MCFPSQYYNNVVVSSSSRSNNDSSVFLSLPPSLLSGLSLPSTSWQYLSNVSNTTNYVLHTYYQTTRHTTRLPYILPYVHTYYHTYNCTYYHTCIHTTIHACKHTTIHTTANITLFVRATRATCASSRTTTCSRSPPCLWRFTKGNDLPQDLSNHDDTGTVQVPPTHIWTRVDSTLGARSSSKRTQARRADYGWVDG